MRWIGRELRDENAWRGRRARRDGRRGERVAARALRRAGYRVLARGWRTPAGELDLLAEEGGTLVLVEVKAGRGPGHDRLGARLDHDKRRRLRRIGRWVGTVPALRGRTMRFDLVLVSFDGWRRLVTIRRDVLAR